MTARPAGAQPPIRARRAVDEERTEDGRIAQRIAVRDVHRGAWTPTWEPSRADPFRCGARPPQGGVARGTTMCA